MEIVLAYLVDLAPTQDDELSLVVQSTELAKLCLFLLHNIRLFFDELLLKAHQGLDPFGLLILAHVKKLAERMEVPPLRLEQGAKALPVSAAILLGEPLDLGQPGVAESGIHGQSAMQRIQSRIRETTALFFVAANREALIKTRTKLIMTKLIMTELIMTKSAE